ncbi:MAG: hypothetical protein CM1200mP29_08150 [Verrucomicrobiota bacterium]|nr:MAG: hypothetical protein CM1200mP29_08150 [Verrucomicrobiota bacterium]
MRLRKRLRENYSIRPFSTEGARVTPWVVLDLIDVLVHVMNDKFRELYDLEGLWGEPSESIRARTLACRPES